MKIDETVVTILQGFSVGIVCILVFFSQSMWLNLVGVAIAVVAIYNVVKDR